MSAFLSALQQAQVHTLQFTNFEFDMSPSGAMGSFSTFNYLIYPLTQMNSACHLLFNKIVLDLDPALFDFEALRKLCTAKHIGLSGLKELELKMKNLCPVDT